MSRARTPNHVYALIGVAIPGMAIVGIRFMGDGASGANAQTGFASAPELPMLRSEPFVPPAGTSDAIEHGRRLARDLGVPSPFEEATVSVSESEQAGSATARSGSTSSDVRVTAILIEAQRTIAVIDGKAHAIGDQVSPGWRLEGIDRGSNNVRLRHVSGSTEIHAIHQFD